MRVLVTGAAGFIGSHVAEELTAAGHDVVTLDLRAGPAGGSVGDIRDAATLARCLAGVDVVCHQAAKVGLGVDVSDMPDYAAVNVTGTAVLLAEMARAGVHRLVLASSMVIYGEGAYGCAEHGEVRPGPRLVGDLDAGRFEPPCPVCGAPLEPGVISEAVPADPRNAYADTKLAQEHLASSWARATGGGVIALRYHNVYGPRMPRDTPYAGVAAIFRSALARGEAPQVYEDGRQRRDFVHVRDVARANVLAVEAVEPGGTLTAVNIASGEPHTVGELAWALSEALAGSAPEVTGAFRLGDVRHIVASPEKARTTLGFKAEVSFADGMAEFATETSAPVIDVVLPCLNEAAALPWVLDRMPAGYRPIVVDNGSSDGSAEIARGLGATVVHEPRRGFGAACHAGLATATAEIVCFMDADGSLDPGELPRLVSVLSAGDADLVLGRRRPTAGGAWPVHARLGNAVLARNLNRKGGTRLRDLGPMRVARREGLLGLAVKDRRFGYPLEMVLRAARAGWRISETDVPYLPRSGRSKVTGTVRGTLRTISDMRRVLSE